VGLFEFLLTFGILDEQPQEAATSSADPATHAARIEFAQAPSRQGCLDDDA
jgi:hypothetical protein